MTSTNEPLSSLNGSDRWSSLVLSAEHEAASQAGALSQCLLDTRLACLQYDTIHYGGTSLGNLRVALACERRRLIPYSLVSYPSYPFNGYR
jgi:hypothetical protein